MARAEKLLERMRANPRDWQIDDVVAVCRAYGLACKSPKRGSHFKVEHPAIDGKLTIPARKPIKSVYILLLVEMIDKLG
ncbi:type II toxin-antitoxin system HicA family toxin [Tsuneonella amylolytica]|uniref:type II toxin-antitoxin system HicA family toxin n=1 Tax=Tsuneonella amylolytica TaxID=2338327 RepID=UPI000EA855A5|nr:type II toxin-antitoxin system HicA family toxin [Tsuneonella amylolytica]